MEKTYNPSQIEKTWYEKWESSNSFSPSGEGTPYCIMIPPPNVTGSLHMGHAFQDTIMDTLIRYNRMKQHNTLWQVGTDHAGIATQMVVERQLNAKGVSRHDLGREAFIEKIWDWKKESGGTITQQLRRLGASVDWSRERFTMDAELSKAVQTVFIQLYREGLIYRGQRLVNWDPVLHTAISDLEVVSEEEKGFLWHIKYPLADNSGHCVIATTRPETLLGDAAVAVHPDDERYQSMIGKELTLPLTGRTIPIIADEYVDPEFGTGCVKITPAHDFNDYEVGKRHKLPLINILNPDASLNENAPKAYQGLDRFEARKKVIEELTELGLLEKIDDHVLKVPRGDRTQSVVEPYLTDQWFVKVESLAAPAREAVENGAIKFVPENWSKTYFEWMNNIQDWCISRQLWWGHRIPAWYDEAGNAYVGASEEEVRQHYQLASDIALQQDEDVLDTWFSSALWPFSTLGWPEKTPELETFYPTNVLVTGFDIIFFWVARMIMFGLKFTGRVPFKEVYIHGLIQDQDGQKMSKSKGNVIDPLDLIDGITLDDLLAKRSQGLMQPQMAKKVEKTTKKQFPEGIPAYGTDALRFTFCSLATTGRHIRFELNRLEGYRNFCNKLWNAARYVLMHTEGHASHLQSGPKFYSVADEWIVSKWQETKAAVDKHYKDYRFDLAAQALYDFTWNEYCDWYLELSKPILFDEHLDESNLRGTRYTLIKVLDELLRVLHPIMPFITEEIWQKVAPLTMSHVDTLMNHTYPAVDKSAHHAESEATIEWIKSMIIGIRTIRAEMNISPNKAIPILLKNGSKQDKVYMEKFEPFLRSLAKIDSVSWLAEGEKEPPAATTLVGSMSVLIPMKGLIDKEQEQQRLTKEIEKMKKDLLKSTTKLSNENYVAKAPQAVVEKEKDKVAELKQAIEKLETSLAGIHEL